MLKINSIYSNSGIQTGAKKVTDMLMNDYIKRDKRKLFPKTMKTVSDTLGFAGLGSVLALGAITVVISLFSKGGDDNEDYRPNRNRGGGERNNSNNSFGYVRDNARFRR